MKQGLLGLTNVKIWAVVTTFYCIDNIAQFLFRGFVLWVNLSLSECSSRSEVHWNIVFGKDPP